MDTTFLKSLVDVRFRNVDEFARALGVSRATPYCWFNKKPEPPLERVISIVEALDMSEGEINQFLEVPEVEIAFRHKGGDLKAREPAVEYGRELANTFFQLDGSAYVYEHRFMPGVIASLNVDFVTNHIRRLLDKNQDEPISLYDTISRMRKININVFYLPFEKLGFGAENSHREVAFTALREDHVIVFADTNRTIDESLFDLAHELAHLVLNHKNIDVAVEDEENFCNSVAQELIYPRDYIMTDAFSIFRTHPENAWHQFLETFKRFKRDFDWSPMGLALSLAEYGLIKKNGIEFKLLMRINSKLKKDLRTIETLVFSKLDPTDYDSLKEFFDSCRDGNLDIKRVFIELMDSAIFDKISYRRFAEILHIDPGDAQELIAEWKAECEEQV